MKVKKNKVDYPMLSARIEPELKEWFKNESYHYRSGNKFFIELKIRYNK